MSTPPLKRFINEPVIWNLQSLLSKTEHVSLQLNDRMLTIENKSVEHKLSEDDVFFSFHIKESCWNDDRFLLLLRGIDQEDLIYIHIPRKERQRIMDYYGTLRILDKALKEKWVVVRVW